MKNDERERFTLRIPKDIYKAIKKEARKQGVSTNALISQILWARLEKEKK